MTNEQLTDKVFEHSEMLAAHNEDIKTLFKQQEAIHDLAKSTQEVAKNVAELTSQVGSMNSRLTNFEEEKAKKSFAVWQIIMSAALGAAATFIVSHILA